MKELQRLQLSVDPCDDDFNTPLCAMLVSGVALPGVSTLEVLDLLRLARGLGVESWVCLNIQVLAHRLMSRWYDVSTPALVQHIGLALRVRCVHGSLSYGKFVSKLFKGAVGLPRPHLAPSIVGSLVRMFDVMPPASEVRYTTCALVLCHSNDSQAILQKNSHLQNLYKEYHHDFKEKSRLWHMIESRPKCDAFWSSLLFFSEGKL